MILAKILLALTIPLTAIIVAAAWANLTTNATKILQGDLPESREYGDGGL